MPPTLWPTSTNGGFSPDAFSSNFSSSVVSLKVRAFASLLESGRGEDHP